MEMSRGRWKTTIIKERLRQAALEVEAVKLASLELEQKIHEKKSIGDSLRQHIGKIIDRVDPLETIAIGGLTYFLQPGILGLEQVTTYAQKNLFTWEALTSWKPWLDAAGVDTGSQPQNTTPASLSQVVLSWVLAFIVAFIMIRHAGKIIETAGNALNLVKMLIPMMAA